MVAADQKPHTGTQIITFPLLILGASELGIIISNVATDLVSLAFHRFRIEFLSGNRLYRLMFSQFASLKPDK